MLAPEEPREALDVPRRVAPRARVRGAARAQLAALAQRADAEAAARLRAQALLVEGREAFEGVAEVFWGGEDAPVLVGEASLRRERGDAAR